MIVGTTAAPRALWTEMFRAVGPCPAGVVPVPEPIEGTAFFPGGLGFWLEHDDTRPPFPKDIMVVGQDFNTRVTYDRARIAGSEVGSSSTWRNIQKVFPILGVPLKDCFFTNVYMGLRTTGPETCRFPGAKDREYAARCATFFKRQIEVAQPRIILTLGLEPLRFLGDRVFGFRHPGAISRCDQIYAPLRAPHGQVAIVALTHPSLYFANVGRRRFDNHVGIEAERAMVRAAAALVTIEETQQILY